MAVGVAGVGVLPVCQPAGAMAAVIEQFTVCAVGNLYCNCVILSKGCCVTQGALHGAEIRAAVFSHLESGAGGFCLGGEIGPLNGLAGNGSVYGEVVTAAEVKGLVVKFSFKTYGSVVHRTVTFLLADVPSFRKEPSPVSFHS